MNSLLLIVVNDAAFFLSHRLPVAQGAKKAGYEVHVASMPGPAVERVRDLGFVHHELPLSRSGKNILGEIVSLVSIWRLLWRLRPDVLHLVTIKPVLYGGIAARLAPVKGVVAAVSGLGFVFLAKGLKATILRRIISSLYGFALGKKNLRVIFQNPDDRDVLVDMGALESDKVEVIRGSGVDLASYTELPEPSGTPVVCLAARLLRDKGVLEFVEAVRILRQRGVSARFQLVGDLDLGNPATITVDELEAWRQDGFIELLGFRKDIAKLFGDAHIVTLPSYREGLPKVLVEAAACGRAVVTTNVPGCRDAIEPGITGLLVPVRNATALADAIETLLNDSELRQRMGHAGRMLAESEFSIEKIVKQHLDIYSKLERTS
ncbi:glycosyltransferase family 4 protein [Pseudomonas sp. PDM10]|uniref:glycosyltransferase family 4 protein n=1 Tax=Pseudomonas sp. PDM10 TaxID=2769269 RepID=UPI00177EBACA|nr:glycosyltransferase family 4 protein [Pseudomonas sp. PDM10]MBD9599031.1 glycosyltransferase family 4 protein [Pseudomonas sp. PDM10]